MGRKGRQKLKILFGVRKRLQYFLGAKLKIDIYQAGVLGSLKHVHDLFFSKFRARYWFEIFLIKWGKSPPTFFFFLSYQKSKKKKVNNSSNIKYVCPRTPMLLAQQ